MSNYLAIATVTASLQKMLQDAVQADVEGARVTTIRLDSIGKGSPETGVNIFLYRVAPLNWRNADLPGRRSNGELIKRPQMALELNYMLTFYGNESELEPQRLLGSVIRTLNSQPILTQSMIESTVLDANYRYLEDSDLQEQIESIKFMFLPLSTEDLSKTWSVFFQTPYSLSVAYQASVVLIEGQEIPHPALPVRESRARVIVNKPTINEIISYDPHSQLWKSNKQPLILSDSAIAIFGYKLKGEKTLVRINSVEKEINLDEVTDKQISLNLSIFAEHELRAGVQSLQVVQQSPENYNLLVSSNVFPFVLLPTIKKIEVIEVEELDDDLYSATLRLSISPMVGKKQPTFVLLNELSSQNPSAYIFKVPSRETDTNIISVKINNVKRGEYLVRIKVSEVESLLDIDRTSNSGNYYYNAPKIFINS